MNPPRFLYIKIRNWIMARGGLQPRGTFWYSKEGHVFTDDFNQRLVVPNIYGVFHPVIRQFWEKNGLGLNCLLVSESIMVKRVMKQYYPETEFVSCDLFPELRGAEKEQQPDIIWDVCTAPLEALKQYAFDSVICQALLEHLIDPTCAIKNMLSLMKSSGHLYLLTHTPSKHKHSFPRDYLRFHHDYFEDLGDYLSSQGQGAELIEFYSKEGIVCACYIKM